MISRGVSVIVCCYNSASRIGATLEHLARQRTSGAWSWEVVVVDNASTDNTAELAAQTWRRLGRADVSLTVANQSKPGLSWARAKGIETAHYDVLIFCDDDNWLAPDYVAEAFSLLEACPQVGAAGGHGTATADVPLPEWFDQYKNCYACYPQGEQDGELSGVYAFLYGAGLVLRRAALSRLEARGFTPLLPDRVGNKLSSGGDTELSYALRLAGYTLWFSEKLVFRHYIPASRLTQRYLYRLVSALSYCSGLLIVYNYRLEGKKITMLTWPKDLTYQIFFFLRALFKYPFVRGATREKKLGLLFAFNKLRGIAVQAGGYRVRDQRIRNLAG
jgi:glycosyltransferase involved in cell wall biosynthesis